MHLKRLPVSEGGIKASKNWEEAWVDLIELGVLKIENWNDPMRKDN